MGGAKQWPSPLNLSRLDLACRWTDAPALATQRVPLLANIVHGSTRTAFSEFKCSNDSVCLSYPSFSSDCLRDSAVSSGPHTPVGDCSSHRVLERLGLLIVRKRVSQVVVNHLVVERLADKCRLGRHIFWTRLTVAAGDYDLDPRSMLGNVAGKSKPIGVAVHLNVQKKQGYARRPIPPKFELFPSPPTAIRNELNPPGLWRRGGGKG